MSQPKTPPWERDATTTLELAINVLWDVPGDGTPAKRAWSELCALQAVAEAAQELIDDYGVIPQMSIVKQAGKLRSALAALEAICPK